MATPDELIHYYKRFVKPFARRYSNRDYDELVSVGLLALISSVRELPIDRSYTGKFLVSRIKNAIRDYVRSERRLYNHETCSDPHWLDNTVTQEQQTTIDLWEALDRHTITDFERDIIRYKAQGMTHREVGFLCSCSIWTVSKVCERIFSRLLGLSNTKECQQ